MLGLDKRIFYAIVRMVSYLGVRVLRVYRKGGEAMVRARKGIELFNSKFSYAVFNLHE